MDAEFNEALYKEIYVEDEFNKKKNILKPSEVEIIGHKKITVDEELHSGVKILLEKDENDNIKEIKFYCSCGNTKSVVLDYSE
ncbi:MAG: hypothetical protein HND52_04050 [Ignavibacteriae bacterium]|nr:hypothetical protein [Ignavibacteriota bacterium]NOG97129.1 hypothetical protein [Ignavibacteriota bacterium]